MAKKKTQILKSQVIAVAGAFIRSGCTYMCVMLADHLSGMGYSVAVIENNDSGHLAAIAEQDGLSISEEGMFVKNRCHYYIYDDSFVSVVNRQYDYVIADYGYIQDCNKNMFYMSDFCILTSMTSPWDMQHIYQVINGEEEFSRNRMIYSFLLCDDTKKQKVLKEILYFTTKTVFIPSDGEIPEQLDGLLNLGTENKKKIIPIFGMLKKPSRKDIQENGVERQYENNEEEAAPDVSEDNIIYDVFLNDAKEGYSVTSDMKEETLEQEETTKEEDVLNVIYAEKTEENTVFEFPEPEETSEEKCDELVQEEPLKDIREIEEVSYDISVPETLLESNETEENEEPEKTEEETFSDEAEAVLEEHTLFIEPMIEEENDKVHYIPDKLPGYKAKSEMCYVYKTFRLEDIQGRYAKQFKFVAYPLEYDNIKPVRMIIGIFYNNKIYVLLSPEDKYSVTFEIDNEKLLFNGQFGTDSKFEVTVTSLNEEAEAKDIKTLKQVQPKSLPDAFPICCGQCVDINEHRLMVYPLYTQNGPLGRCAFMYSISYPDGGMMVGTSEEDYLALIPIEGVVQSVECRWIKLCNEKHLVANLL